MRLVIPLIFLLVQSAFAQFERPPDVVRELTSASASNISINNLQGRVVVKVIEEREGETVKFSLNLYSEMGVVDVDLVVSRGAYTVRSTDGNKRIDVVAFVPERSRISIQTSSGAIEASGNFESVTARSETGTIALDVPDDDVRYAMLWTESRPRFVSDLELKPIRERSAGRFETKGTVSARGSVDKTKTVRLDLTTARGIILLNVPPNEVSADLRPRPLTNAAKAIIRSGDSLLTEAIRRASPKYFGDYARTLPPISMEPRLRSATRANPTASGGVQTISVRITDAKGRAIDGISQSEFQVTAGGKPVEVVGVKRSESPFNLVLLADVSGSVENYVDFIRKAAREFVETVDPRDRVAIIIFNDDVDQLSRFTTDRTKLSASLDTFDAGGGTALYDALAYVLADTLRQLNGERSAIVVLSDGDDNASFLAFDSLIGSIQESGSLIYPMYVPSGLIAASTNVREVDPLRGRYLSLSAKSEREGERMAAISGGVFYKIDTLDDIQRAYDDIVKQLRTSYDLTIRSAEPSGRLRVSVGRENVSVTINETGK